MEAPTAQWVTVPSQAIPTTNRPGTLGGGSLSPHPSDHLELPSRDQRPTGNSLTQGPNRKESLAQTPGLRQFLKDRFLCFWYIRVFLEHKITYFKRFFSS